MTDEHKAKIGAANRGRVPSRATIEAARKANIGRTPWNKGLVTGIVPWNKGLKTPCKGGGFKPGYTPWNKGKKHSKETRDKIRAAHLGRTGELASNWQGGKDTESNKERRSDEMRLWKRAVLERDGFKCQKCNSIKDLHVHHINNFSEFIELRTSIENGIVLCHDCHFEFHKRYGKRENSLEQIKEFFNSAGGYE